MTGMIGMTGMTSMTGMTGKTCMTDMTDMTGMTGMTDMTGMTGMTGMTDMINMTDMTGMTDMTADGQSRGCLYGGPPGDIVNTRWRFWTHVWILPRKCWTHERSHDEILGHILGPHAVCILIYMLIQ